MRLRKFKDIVEKIFLILCVILITGVLLAIYVVPYILIKDVDISTYKLIDDNQVYERAYNIYGKQIYKHRKKAFAQFNKDYKEILDYMHENIPIKKFASDYKTISLYEMKGWQYRFTEDEQKELGEDKVEELKHKLYEVSAFCATYENTNWRYYILLLGLA